MADLATSLDVEARWRPLSAAEQVVADTLIAEVSAMIRLRVPDIDTRIATDLNLAVVVRGVVAEAVRRVLSNPDGWRELSIDDYRQVRDVSVSSGALYVSDVELASLRPAAARARSVRLVAYGDA